MRAQLKKGGIRCGHNPKKRSKVRVQPEKRGVLGGGTSQKRGGGPRNRHSPTKS